MRPDVMIVDDADDHLQMMRTVFRMVDTTIKVATARSGEEALEMLRADPTRRPKVILLDLRMPGLSGLEVLSELKADPQFKRIPVCAFSNGDIEGDVCQCYDQGASVYFKKPVGLENLKAFATQFKRVWFEFATFCQN